MIRRLKSSVRRKITNLFRSAIGPEIRRLEPSGASTRILQHQLFHWYRHLAKTGGPLPSIFDTGYRVFSQCDEDGLLLYIFGVIRMKNRTFVDIGAGDGVANSNCANLALNFGWHGLFIDTNKVLINRGRQFYERHSDTFLYPPLFVYAKVNRENINHLIEQAGFKGEIDLLSIDIDGNDYWIWDALECITPRVVIIETHVEFGYNNIVVPYDPDYEYPERHPDYHGASPVAMVNLARRKGYRLVGANRFGYNTIYVRNDEGKELLPEISVKDVLQHPRNAERMKLFEAIKGWQYVEG